MNVCAIPVGHEETPTITFPPSEDSGVVRPEAVADADSDGPPPVVSGWTCSVTMRAMSSGVVTARRVSVNSLFIRPRASLASSLRWTSSAPEGAAIMKTRSARPPSAAPKSTGWASLAKPREGASTWGLRQCGMATPPGIPVDAVSSRAMASPARPSAVSARPAEAMTCAR